MRRILVLLVMAVSACSSVPKTSFVVMRADKAPMSRQEAERVTPASKKFVMFYDRSRGVTYLHPRGNWDSPTTTSQYVVRPITFGELPTGMRKVSNCISRKCGVSAASMCKASLKLPSDFSEEKQINATNKLRSELYPIVAVVKESKKNIGKVTLYYFGECGFIKGDFISAMRNQ